MVRFTSEILSSNIGPPLIIAALAAIAGHHLGRQAPLVCVAPSPQQRSSLRRLLFALWCATVRNSLR